MKGMRGKKPRIPLRYFQSDPAASRHGLRRDVFQYSRERRSEVKVNLPDFRRFTVIGLAAERNVALG